jgi:hypothetical protein
MATDAVLKEFIFVQMYFYESEDQIATMNQEFQIIADIFAPVNVIAEQSVISEKVAGNTTRISRRNQRYNILPNTTEPMKGAYRINTVVIPYIPTNDEDIRKINLVIRKLGHNPEWFMIGDVEDLEKEYNILSTKLRSSIYPYQLWLWIKYIQEKRSILASVSSNNERTSVKKAIDSALQNIKEIYVDPIYPQCIETIRTLGRNNPVEEYVRLQPEMEEQFSMCYKDFMLQVYIAVKAGGFGRTSEKVKAMITNMYKGLGIPSGEMMEIIQSMREGAAQERFRETEVDPLWNPTPTLYFRIYHQSTEI